MLYEWLSLGIWVALNSRHFFNYRSIRFLVSSLRSFAFCDVEQCLVCIVGSGQVYNCISIK